MDWEAKLALEQQAKWSGPYGTTSLVCRGHSAQRFQLSALVYGFLTAVKETMDELTWISQFAL